MAKPENLDEQGARATREGMMTRVIGGNKVTASFRFVVAKAALIAGALFALFSVFSCVNFEKGPVGNRHVPEPAKPVERDRYLGRWYELARYEASFQKGCAFVTADYSLRADGKIEVINSCRRGGPDAPLDSAQGRAYVVEGSDGAKLRVSFFWPFYGNYWILDHGEAYDWTIVGEPSGRYLWLMAREPHPSQAFVQKLKQRAAQMGYDLSLLKMTRQ